MNLLKLIPWIMLLPFAVSVIMTVRQVRRGKLHSKSVVISVIVGLGSAAVLFYSLVLLSVMPR